MYVFKGNIYLEKEHVEIINNEPDYIKERYFAIAKAIISPPFKIGYKAAATLIGICIRHFYRILKRFREEGISGLRKRSTRPKTSPNQTPREIEEKVVEVRKASGFGPRHVATLVNESFHREGRDKKLWASTTYNILVRSGEIENERRIQNEWKRFEWGHPNRLIQADLTKFNGVHILTMEDDHSRRGWAMVLKDAKDDTVIEGMIKLIPFVYDNLLTDNGAQFSRRNSAIRRYCEQYVREKHIWTSSHHPQTMGKLSSYQKGLKMFLRHRLGGSRNKREINHWIDVYNHWYNNGRYHSAIDTYPEERYSGKRDDTWYERLVKALKLENVLTIC